MGCIENGKSIAIKAKVHFTNAASIYQIPSNKKIIPHYFQKIRTVDLKKITDFLEYKDFKTIYKLNKKFLVAVSDPEVLKKFYANKSWKKHHNTKCYENNCNNNISQSIYLYGLDQTGYLSQLDPSCNNRIEENDDSMIYKKNVLLIETFKRSESSSSYDAQEMIRKINNSMKIIPYANLMTLNCNSKNNHHNTQHYFTKDINGFDNINTSNENNDLMFSLQGNCPKIVATFGSNELTPSFRSKV